MTSPSSWTSPSAAPDPLADSGLGEFRRQLAYKCQRDGAELVVADRWFASSKACYRCGTVKAELELLERTYRWAS